MRKILSRLFGKGNSLDTKGLSPESLQMMLDNSYSEGFEEGKRSLITSWKPHTHLVIFSNPRHLSYGIRDFCHSNGLVFNKPNGYADCMDTGDRYYFCLVSQERDIDNIGGFEVQNIIWMDKPISEYVRCVARSRLRNR